jgi:hypothetical protein
VEHTYDNRSRRIGKVVSHFENDTWTVAESRSFVYDGWNMVQEFSTLNSQSGRTRRVVLYQEITKSLSNNTLLTYTLPRTVKVRESVDVGL